VLGVFLRINSGDPYLCAAGGALHLNHSHFFNFKAGLSGGFNNYAEILALKLLYNSVEKWFSKHQVFGDSRRRPLSSTIVPLTTGIWEIDINGHGHCIW